MSFRWIQVIDGGGEVIPPDQEPTATEAAANASKKTPGSFTVQKLGLNVVQGGKYQFAFAYLYEDPENPSETLEGPRSTNFTFNLDTPDLTREVTNLVVTPGLLAYGVKWDPIDKNLPENKWFIDAQIYESLTGAFAGEEYLVWNGTGNSATILVSDTNNRWIRVYTRDADFHRKGVTYGPFKATDPIVVDVTGPGNVSSVTTNGGLDTTGIVGFNGYANISWPAVTGGGIRGYRIRFRPITTPESSYSYADSPGTGTSYRLAGLGAGLVYEIAVATYDEYNNTSSSYIAGTNVTVGGTPYIASTVDVSGFFRAKANPGDADSTAFKFGYGIETGKRGLLFNTSNYWHIDSNQSALFKVGGPTANYLLWDGAKLTVDGDINAKGGTFSGNIFMSTSGASIYNGTIDSATGNLTGNGFALNSTGLKVASGTNSVTLSAANGTITANAGSIAGWNLSGTTLSKNNVILDSAGQIQVGSTAAQSIYLKSSGSFVMWAGNNTPDANAKFRVGSDGTLYATNAVLGSGTTVAGYATTGSLANYALTSALANYATTTALAGVKSTADAALPSTSFSKLEVLKKLNNSTNGATLNGGILEAGTVVADNVVSTYVYAGYIDAEKINAGMITGVDIDISTDSSSGRFKTSYMRSGPVDNTSITSTAINAVAFVSTTTSGWVTSCYPYWNGGADLGIGSFRWRRLLIGNGSYGVAADSYVDLGGNITRLYADGRIFANTLGTGSGSTIVQSSGFLRVQTSSSRYKENILEINKSGYLDLLYQLKPVTYTYKEEFWPEGNRPVLAGLIAEDVNAIEEFRTVVNYNEDGLPDSIAYDRMSSLLILAIKEIKDKIDTLESRLDALGA
jgi:hypothetical protein